MKESLVTFSLKFASDRHLEGHPKPDMGAQNGGVGGDMCDAV